VRARGVDAYVPPARARAARARREEAESAHCDWYVEKALLQERVGGLQAQIAARDAMEERMEACVYAIFERLQGLELANYRLRERLHHRGTEERDGDVDGPRSRGDSRGGDS
jgi:hypothetical protein